MGFDDNTIIQAVRKVCENAENCVVHRTNTQKRNRSIHTDIVVESSAGNFKMIEKVLVHGDHELYRLALLNRLGVSIPKVYMIDFESKAMLLEDLNEEYISGSVFDEEHPHGEIYRRHINDVLSVVAELHLKCWDNGGIFREVGLPWHLDHFFAHMQSVERDYGVFRKAYWNKMDEGYFAAYEQALDFLNSRYPDIIENRFHKGKNITVIHGDFHPGNTFLSKNEKRAEVRMVDFEGVRMGLAVDDLVMFLALHVAPSKTEAMPFLNHYYRLVSERVCDYSFNEFLSDYNASIAENLFFPIKLINNGISDFRMARKSLIAYKTFKDESK